MRRIIGSFFTFLGIIAIGLFGLWGFIIELTIINYVAGFWGIVIGFMILPATLVATPWYALIAWGNWLPLLVVYGGCATGMALIGIGSAISGE